jgi:hypothetical protein
VSDLPAYKNKKQKRYEEWAEEDEVATSREQAAVRLGKTRQAMQMRVDGYDYSEIAYQLGYGTAEAAANDVHTALEEEFLQNQQYSSEILRMIELKRLNTMYNALLPGISRGNSRAVDVGVKISDRISKMSGLDAPIKTEAVEMRMVEAEIVRLRQEIEQKHAVRLALEAPVLDAEVVD